MFFFWGIGVFHVSTYITKLLQVVRNILLLKLILVLKFKTSYCYAHSVKLHSFIAESVCCFDDFDIMSGSALFNLDVKTAKNLSEGKFCIFFVQALQPKLIVSSGAATLDDILTLSNELVGNVSCLYFTRSLNRFIFYFL